MNTLKSKSAMPLITDWSQIDWQKINRYVEKLQQRIYHAERTGDKRKVRNPPPKGGRRSRRGKRCRPPARPPQPFLSCFFSPCSAHLSLFVIFLLRCQRQKPQRLFVFVLMGKGNIQLLFATDADALYHVNERPAV